MEVRETPAVASKRPPPTPKAIIHQKFGKQACYTTEEVLVSVQNDCPGLSIPQHGPRLYRCTLQLPDFSITSESCKKKKDAEQAAAKLAIEKLGIPTTTSNPTKQEACDELVSRISYLFSDEFLSSLHPLTGHLSRALRRESDPHGLVSVPILAACDSKLNNLCKYINPKAESNILFTLELIAKAARLCCSVTTSDEKLWIWKQTPYTEETREALLNRNLGLEEDVLVEALYIPCSMEKPVKSVSLNVSPNAYYMDVIAQKLAMTDTSHILVSRIVGKSSCEMRLYFTVPHLSLQLDTTSTLLNAREPTNPDATLNARACYFSGQDIYGDAILAAIGYTWKFTELFNENVSLGAYYRMLVGRLPDGGYKLSREAILAAELPSEFTNRSNWRGSFPRDLLCAFCRQNWLLEPEFSIICSDDVSQSSEIPETCKKLKLSKSSEEVNVKGGTADTNCPQSAGQRGVCMCEVKILSKNQELIIECLPQGSFRRQNDAIQNASLKVLSWLKKYFQNLNTPLEKWSFTRDIDGILVYPHNFRKEFSLYLSVHNLQQNSGLQRCTSLGLKCTDQFNKQSGLLSVNSEGSDSGVYLSNGSLACISYSICLKQEGENTKEVVESCDEFEFEIGSGAVTPLIESHVNKMAVEDSACFISELPSHHLILAAAHDRATFLSSLNLQNCCLEYCINLKRVTEPLEERMEQALFSPSLSKQRVEYALEHIHKSGATTLVDFGCGSGSLLESLMSYPTSLEKFVGVDISPKGLTRAAKVLHSKLTASSQALNPNTGIKSAILYNGSITVFDRRLYKFDIGTCLEVIEHMEEEQARLFGDVVLGSFRPKILIVSTPNYEYNPVLQGSTPSSQEEECKFRNHDHKFEWTRSQFNCWASEVASRHNYSVEFSGVGGQGDLEPGFASQIAVFRDCGEAEVVGSEEMSDEYELIWEWDNSKLKSNGGNN